MNCWTNDVRARELRAAALRPDRCRGDDKRVLRSDLPRIRENLGALSARKANLRAQGAAGTGARGPGRRLAGIAAAAIAGTVLFTGQPAAAAPIACGTAYTVEKRDTLFRIAVRAYGDGWKYKLLFDANRDLLPSAESLEVDTQILVPCLDGKGPATRKDAIALGLISDAVDPGAAEQPFAGAEEARADTKADTGTGAYPEDDDGSFLEAAAKLAARVILPGQGIVAPTFAEPAPEPAGHPIRFLTGSGFAPYADEALRGGGIVTDLVAQAFAVAAPDQSYQVSFVNDWDSHVRVLLPIGAFEIGYPWLKPDCEQPDGLGEAQKRLCDQFEFSRPIQAVQIGYYVRTEDPLAAQTDIGALSGKRLCIAQGHLAVDLAQAGLLPPDASLETGLTAEQCFEQLDAGEVDAVAHVDSDNDAQTGPIGLADSVVEIRGLRTTRFLHAIASKAIPEALAALEAVNRGMDEVMRSGQWFTILSNHLADQKAGQTGT